MDQPPAVLVGPVTEDLEAREALGWFRGDVDDLLVVWFGVGLGVCLGVGLVVRFEMGFVVPLDLELDAGLGGAVLDFALDLDLERRACRRLDGDGFAVRLQGYGAISGERRRDFPENARDLGSAPGFLGFERGLVHAGATLAGSINRLAEALRGLRPRRRRCRGTRRSDPIRPS